MIQFILLLQSVSWHFEPSNELSNMVRTKMHHLSEAVTLMWRSTDGRPKQFLPSEDLVKMCRSAGKSTSPPSWKSDVPWCSITTLLCTCQTWTVYRRQLPVSTSTSAWAATAETPGSNHTCQSDTGQKIHVSDPSLVCQMCTFMHND